MSILMTNGGGVVRTEAEIEQDPSFWNKEYRKIQILEVKKILRIKILKVLKR